MDKTINQYINQLHLDPKKEAAVRKLIQAVSNSSGNNSNGGNSSDNNIDTSNYNFVDLGLPSGTLWCDRNLGAENPESIGSVYTWGDNKPYTMIPIDSYRWEIYDKDSNNVTDITNYVLDNYKHLKAVSDAGYGFTKYTILRAGAHPDSFLDYKWKLDAVDDVAKEYNSNWSIPSPKQIQELIDYCNIIIYDDKVEIVSKINGNTIIVPKPSESYLFWSNELGFNTYYSSRPVDSAMTFVIANWVAPKVDCKDGYSSAFRSNLIPIRPVISNGCECNSQVIVTDEFLYGTQMANGIFYAKICYAIKNKLPILNSAHESSDESNGNYFPVNMEIGVEINKNNLDIETIYLNNPITKEWYTINKDLSVESGVNE